MGAKTKRKYGMPDWLYFFPLSYVLTALLIWKMLDWYGDTIHGSLVPLFGDLAGGAMVIFGHLITFFGYGSVVHLMDKYPHRLWAKLKTHRRDCMGFFDLLPQVLGNFAVEMALGAFFYTFIYPSPDHFMTLEAPTFTEGLIKTVAFLILHDFTSYCGHRALHSKLLYNRFHKLHHSTMASTGISAMYATPLDWCLTQFFPILLVSSIVRIPLRLGIIFSSIGGLAGIQDHAGYALPFFNEPILHNNHHFLFNVNYAPIGITDLIFGTSNDKRNVKAPFASPKSANSGRILLFESPEKLE